MEKGFSREKISSLFSTDKVENAVAMPVNLPTTMLRSFVAIVDTGSMLNASEQVFVTQSALSLQIKRLEELVQQQLFLREGRRLALTAAGETLLGYARRLLSLHDEALTAISERRFSGPVRIGMVQDFADLLLTGLLARFAELHDDASIFARVAGTAELVEMLERGQLDIVIGYAAALDPDALRITPMGWFGDEALAAREVLPLAVLEKPCRFREAAIAALEAEGRRWRIAVETPNLSTLRAAVAAGLGVTCRTGLLLKDLERIEGDVLPALPEVACILLLADGRGEAARHLAGLTRDLIGEL
jgi:DNA-binding transcriptional LysR family regulator